jgi:hypothetical protein
VVGYVTYWSDMKSTRLVQWVLMGLAGVLATSAVPARSGGKAQLAVAWRGTDPGDGSVGAMRLRLPYEFLPPVDADRDVSLHATQDKLFVLNRETALVKVVDFRRGTVLRSYPLGAGGMPQDIAVADARTAYVTRDGAARLQRLDLRSGVVSNAADLTPFADEDEAVHPAMMTLHQGRLFVQMRRPEALGPDQNSPHGYLAVVNAKTGQLVDANRMQAGVQGIALQGTMPRLRMQVVGQRLYVSATGRFHDAGGLEAINLRALRSEGLVIREDSGTAGADLGPFIFVTPTRGFLVFSTDLTLSSHLLPFTLDRGVGPGPEFHVSVDYFVPALAHDRRSNRLFLPDGIHGRQGIFAFNARTGEKLTAEPIAVDGVPTDIVFLP